MATRQKDTPFANISSEFDKGTAGADALRAHRLEQLTVARQAKDTGLKREYARMTKKLGADHPRVVQIAGKMKVNAGLQRDLLLETARARTEIPQVDEKSWAVLGFVRDANRKGIPDLIVAPYDGKGNWAEPLGYACTDLEGRFRIESTNIGQVDGPVSLRVSAADKSVLYVDPSPITPTGGSIDYREITLTKGTQTCAPPVSNPDARVPARGSWVVRGRVTDDKQQGLSDLIVSVYDKDLIFDDRLGETKTDQDGKYELTYRTDDFRDLIEKKPDLYVKILDQKGETLFSSKKAVRYEAGRVETIDVVIADQSRK